MSCPSLKFVLGLPYDVTELYSAAATSGQLLINTDKGSFILKTDKKDAEWIKLSRQPRLTLNKLEATINREKENQL